MANHFYTDIPGDFLVIELDTRLLTTEVKYEPAAPVGDKATKGKYAQTPEDAPLFPHLYGGIPKSGSCLVGLPLPVARDASTGQFLSIAYPIAQITPQVYIASSAAVSNPTTMNTLSEENSSRGTFASLQLISTQDATNLPLAFVPAMTHVAQLSDDDALSTDIPILNCLSFIDTAVQAGHRVVVHSSHGASRASSIVVAHLMFNNGTSLADTLAVLRQKWPRAQPRPYFMSQLSELDQGDGHDPSVAMRAVADIMSGGSGNSEQDTSPTTLADDEIENIIEFDDDDDVAPLSDEDDEDDQDDQNATMDDDDAMRRAAAEAAGGEEEEGGAATTGLDQLPAENIEEMAQTVYQGHSDAVCCIAASPVSTMMVSGGCDDKAYLWDATTGETAFLLGEGTTAHKETVSVCAFNFDGKNMVVVVCLLLFELQGVTFFNML